MTDPTPAPRRLVFVSHSSKDTQIARHIAQQIEACGAATFLDVNAIEVGMNFLDVILDNLRRADELVVLWSPAALESRFVYGEMFGAWVRGIPIIQFAHEMTVAEVERHPLLPPFLRPLHMVALEHVDQYLEQLSRRIRDSAARL